MLLLIVLSGLVPHCGAFSTPHSQQSRILFSNNFSLHSSLNARDHASQPYCTAENIIVLYILIFKFLKRSREEFYHIVA